MTTQKAIKFFDDEISRLNYAPELNGCEMTEEWKEQLEICKMAKDALENVNRQKAKIEALQMDNAQLQSDVIHANQNYDHIKELWEDEKEKVAKAKRKVIDVCKMLKTAKTEAVEEYKEKLIFEIVNTPTKKQSGGVFYLDGVANRQFEIIDIIKGFEGKEMVGEG